MLALRRGGGGAKPRAVVLQDHRLRRRAARVRPARGCRRLAERTKAIQRNWIGRSEGQNPVPDRRARHDVPVFTTRPDTLFGATFFVLAPEHPLVERIDSEDVQAYAKQTAARRGEERATEEEKTGVFTGFYATNPVNGDKLPVYVADYVLMEYGTIMAVPAHDERDREFAEAFGLPIVEVVTEDGVLVNSGEFDGLPADEGGGDRRTPAADGRASRGLLSPPRLELLAAALLGLVRFPSSTARTTVLSPCRRRAAGAAAGGRGLPAEGRAAARLE